MYKKLFIMDFIQCQGVTTLIAVFGMCSDDGKAVVSALTSSKLRHSFIS